MSGLSKERKSGREGNVPSESNFGHHQGKSCGGHRLEAVFEGVEYSTGVPCVCNQTTGGIRKVKLLE